MQPSPDAVRVSLSPLEKGYYRVVSGENEIFDVPNASIEHAKEFDKDLRILQKA